MKKILFLIPPSEWKKMGGEKRKQKQSFVFEKPKEKALEATQKDLKCIGKRFEEAKKLNENIFSWNIQELLFSIERYTGVMYQALDYENMSIFGKKYFDTHFLIISGMYGLLKPHDTIANYKLPIETKWLARFWKENITQTLNDIWGDIIVDLLPESYKKMIDWKLLNASIVQVEFLTFKQWKSKKMSHGVKTIKGNYIKNICEKGFTDISQMMKEKRQTISIIAEELL